MEHNPYAPPMAAVTDAAIVPEDEDIASRGQRFVNLLIDWFLRGVLLVIARIVMIRMGWYELFPNTPLGNWLLGAAIVFLYYVTFESVFGRTPGKLLTRTRVVTTFGGTPTFLQIVGRTLGRLVPFEAFSFFTSAPVVGWHDSWSNTRVIRTSR